MRWRGAVCAVLGGLTGLRVVPWGWSDRALLLGLLLGFVLGGLVGIRLDYVATTTPAYRRRAFRRLLRRWGFR